MSKMVCFYTSQSNTPLTTHGFALKSMVRLSNFTCSMRPEKIVDRANQLCWEGKLHAELSVEELLIRDWTFGDLDGKEICKPPYEQLLVGVVAGAVSSLPCPPSLSAITPWAKPRAVETQLPSRQWVRQLELST